MTSPSCASAILGDGVGDGDLVRRLLVLLVGHDGPAAERVVSPDSRSISDADIHLVLEALLRRRCERELEREEHGVLRDVLLARERIDQQQEFLHAFSLV
jgi:hypothetical protein